jgi:ankyrin repeat protein
MSKIRTWMLETDMPLYMLGFDRGHTDTCAMLLEHKADVNKAKSTSGRTALHFACEAGYMDTATILIKQGADINVASRVRGDGGVWRGDQRTALHCAACV